MIRFGFILLFLPFDLLAQTFTPAPDWRFENFDSQNHFVSRSIQNIAIDKSGYAWTCGLGVEKFDGVKTVEYNSFNGATGNLKSNYTSDIAVDQFGKVWIGAGGLCYYDSATDKFVYIQPGAKRNLTYAFAFRLQNNLLWFVCDYGLAKIDLRTLKISFTSIKSMPDPIETCLSNDNTLWVTSREKLYTYNISKNTYTARSFMRNKSRLKIFGVEKGNDIYYLATNQGMMTMKDADSVPEPVKGFEHVSVNDLQFSPGDEEKKYLLIATDNQGLLLYNTIYKKIEFSYLHDEENPYSLPSNLVTKITTDKNGYLWVCTSVGISLLDPDNQQLKVRFIKKSYTDNAAIYKILQDKFDTSKVWMSCFNIGIACVNWKTKKIEKLFDADARLQKIIDFVQVDRDKWLLLNNNAVFEWGPKHGIERTIKKIAGPDSVALSINFRQIIKSGDKTYFITTNRGMFKYNLPDDEICPASTTKDFSFNTSYDLLSGFYENGTIWAASRNGLFKYELDAGKTTVYNGPDKSDFFLADITRAGDDKIACGGSKGLLLFNKKTNKFKIFRVLAGIDNAACSHVKGMGHMLWISSEAGMLKFDINTGKSERVVFDTPFLESFSRSPVEVFGNQIVFGLRNNAYIYFNPSLKTNITPSWPVIENIYVSNRKIPMGKTGANDREKSIFAHDDNSLNISFTSFLYNNPEHIIFRYKLKGADKTWHTAIDQRNANYTQLGPGNYTFYVQCGNINGVWNKHVTSFSFLINPAYWQSWWFRTLAVLLMAYGFYGFYQYRMKNIKAIEQIRDGIANDFHDDLGSTLSVISIYSEVALKKSETDLTATKRIVEDMGIRARAMVQSMSDMVWIIKPENDTLAHLVQRMEEFSYPVAEAKEIQLVFKMDEGLSALKIDMLKRKSLFLIFKEAFNNSVKYSGAGKIEVILDIEQKKMLTMQIIDNGAGFNLAKKKHGNGLASMQKRAKEISGTIKIETATGAGTSVYINCSIA